MIEECKALLIGTFDRLKNPDISKGLWGLVLLSALAMPLLTPLLDAVPEDGPALLHGIATFAFACAIIWLIFAVYWKLTRASADYRDRKGDFWAWLGWSLVAYVPSIVALVGLFFANGGEEHLVGQTLAFLLLPTLLVPVLVHSSGRAIDASGPNIGAVVSAWLPHYAALLLAYLILVAPATLLSEAVYALAGDGILPDMVASLVYLPASVLGILLTVEAFHRTSLKLPA